MKCGAHFDVLLIFSGRVDAIGQKNDEELLVRIDPDGSAGESGMAEGMRAEELSARSAWSRCGPSQRPRATGKLLLRREFLDGRSTQNSLVRIDAAVEHHLAECRQVRRRAEDPGVARYSANRGRILVVNFALNLPTAILVVHLRRRDGRPDSSGRIIH